MRECTHLTRHGIHLELCDTPVKACRKSEANRLGYEARMETFLLVHVDHCYMTPHHRTPVDLRCTVLDLMISSSVWLTSR